MSLVVILLLAKLVTLAGSIAITVGFVGLFAFRETLGPHVATLLVSGVVLVGVGEGLSWFIGRWASASTTDDDGVRP